MGSTHTNLTTRYQIIKSDFCWLAGSAGRSGRADFKGEHRCGVFETLVQLLIGPILGLVRVAAHTRRT